MSSGADAPSLSKGLLNTDKGSFALKETLKYKGFFAVIASKFCKNLRGNPQKIERVISQSFFYAIIFFVILSLLQKGEKSTEFKIYFQFMDCHARREPCSLAMTADFVILSGVR